MTSATPAGPTADADRYLACEVCDSAILLIRSGVEIGPGMPVRLGDFLLPDGEPLDPDDRMPRCPSCCAPGVFNAQLIRPVTGLRGAP